jgi:hypothetical protein
MNKGEEKYFDDLLRLLEKAYSDYLLLNRIIYKVKNLFFRQKQYKYLIQLKKMLKRLVFDSIEEFINFNLENKNLIQLEKPGDISLVLKELKLFKDENLKDLNELMERIGLMIKEMLKLKLYIPYSVVMLNVIR